MSLVAGITVVRWIRPTAADHEPRRESKTAKTWAAATELVRLFGGSRRADPGSPITVRPRWRNGLVFHEFDLTEDEAAEVGDLGVLLETDLRGHYGANKRLRSMRAVVAREILSRCSFVDGEGSDGAEDARVLDAVSRSLKQCYPDHAELYIERVRGWMLAGGGVK